ncbi:ABC transporter family substrate-binding protein [Streptomyces candidus]|uniref:Peptide/nickel transport system substrate-binding protein n=1 Tax=Streptomyces candidus TaxID=67283 RepID=A0A7X0HCT3_9ACTN|nr:ABC transporter family substrate-binding protein [Streptomyces candidus]MBB6435280.1 peptide/nickel transport system substrate-binding protein [Streptomyces candidus]GHH40174.1 lipoprotein [Streptomyces candidus]
MSDVGFPSGRPSRRFSPRRSSRARRGLALLTSGVLALPALAACGGSEDEEATGGVTAVSADLAAAQREQVADGGTLDWAVDSMPPTYNAFQADADATTARVAGAVLPSLFVLDEAGRPQRNPDFLEDASIIEREPKQVVLYKINQQAVWSDGREIGAADFVAQWRALRGEDSAFWTARNAGYERIEKIEKGADNLEVKVTYAKPYADWRSLFTPLYPKAVMGTPNAFNDGSRAGLKQTAGPFRPANPDREDGSVVLERNPRWWGKPAKLDKLVLREVPRDKRASALAAGRLDIAEIDPSALERIERAAKEGGKARLTHGPGSSTTPAQALRSWARAHGAVDEEEAEAEQEVRAKARTARRQYEDEQRALRGFTVRKSLEPAYTQLALNGASGPLADERVRRAVARALNRQEIAETVLKPLGLPAAALGSHLALAGQDSYADGSDALGSQDTGAAQTLLAEAGWTRDGAARTADAGRAGSRSDEQKKKPEQAKKDGDAASDDGMYIVGDDGKSGEDTGRDADGKSGDGKSGDDPFRVRSGTYVLAPAPGRRDTLAAPQWQRAPYAEDDRTDSKTEAQEKKGGMAGAYAPRGTAAPRAAGEGDAAAGSAKAPLLVGKNGKPLSLRFVLPADPGSAALRTVGARISRMLETIGVRTEITKVEDASYFKDHIASGDFDLALYSWPGTAYPATDGRPIFAKPEPAADGSLLVEQNYTRVGTDHIDQLFDQAAAELDEEAARELVRKADQRIWAAAGSIPLYQRPELVAVRPNLVNAGAFGFSSPRYQDIGFKKPDSAKDARK